MQQTIEVITKMFFVDVYANKRALFLFVALIRIKVTKALFIVSRISRPSSHRKSSKTSRRNVSVFFFVFNYVFFLFFWFVLSLRMFAARQNRHKLIICENQPVELPPDVVRG